MMLTNISASFTQAQPTTPSATDSPALQAHSASDQLQQFLLLHDHRFEDSVKKPGISFMSSDLKKLLVQLKDTQHQLTPHNLSCLQHKLDQWQHQHPREFGSRGAQAQALRQEIRQRQQDPLLGLAGSAHTNIALLQLVRQVHGEQAYALFARKVPALNSNTPLQHDTLTGLLKALQSPVFAQFKHAMQLVKKDLLSPFDQQAVSLVTTELAKMPRPLLDALTQQGLRVAVTHERIFNASDFDLSHLSENARGWQGQSSARNLPGAYQMKNNTTIISLTRDAQGDWQINPQHGACNLVLHETAHGVDILLGKSLGIGKLSQQPGFRQAWEQDFQQLDSYFRQQDEHGDYRAGLEEAFAEGLANTYHSAQPSPWPHIDAYMKALPARIQNGDHSQL